MAIELTGVLNNVVWKEVAYGLQEVLANDYLIGVTFISYLNFFRGGGVDISPFVFLQSPWSILATLTLIFADL